MSFNWDTCGKKEPRTVFSQLLIPIQHDLVIIIELRLFCCRSQPLIIPFRESKLTRLFQGFFCGKGRASMIVNVNMCASMFDETFHVMKFSAIAKKVTEFNNIKI